ncbi:hypothetical protein CEY12_00260 [Chryseobacterium sp. T16E-39]|nr:hypothetical protein CEY12_00260 [Chryseobacterium sp. T16E-39]
MREEFFLKGKKYKFFLGFHLFVLVLYSIFMIIALKSHHSSSSYKYYESNISETLFKYTFYIIINLILSLVLYLKIKNAKVILNLFATIIFIILCYALYTLIITYQNNTYYNFVICFNILIVGFIIFYISYLNIKSQEDQNNEIESLGQDEE